MINGSGEGGMWIWIHPSTTTPLPFMSPLLSCVHLRCAFVDLKGQFI